MFKKILRLYLISIFILGILGLIYTAILHFTENEKHLLIASISIGIIFFFSFSFILMKIFKKRVVIYVTLFFIINYAIIWLCFIGTDNSFTGFDILKIAIYYITSLCGGILGRKKN